MTNIPIPTENVIQSVIHSASQNAMNYNPSMTAGFDLRTLIGIPGLTAVEAFVNYLVETWGLRKGLAPIASYITAIVLNIAIAGYLHLDLFSAILTGFWIGYLASEYHEKTTPK